MENVNKIKGPKRNGRIKNVFKYLKCRRKAGIRTEAIVVIVTSKAVQMNNCFFSWKWFKYRIFGKKILPP